MDSDALQFAGEYELENILIKSVNGVELDFKQLNLELNIYEGIYENTIYGTITLRDSANHIQYMPIIGQEEIRFLLKTPSFSDTINFREYKGRIYKVTNQMRTIEREQVYTLHFMTQESLDNTRTRLSRAFTDTPSNIVKNVLQNTIRTDKPLFIEDTKSVHKIVSPNLRPFDLISMLRKRSESKFYDTPGYLFFENHRGYHFRSYESLSYNGFEPRPHVWEFYDSIYTKTDEGVRVVDVDLSTIEKYDFIRTNDLVANTITGMLSSTHYTHDIHTKSWTKTEYQYFNNFDKTKHTDEREISKQNFGAFYSRTPETLDGKTVADFSKSKIYVSPRATKLHSQTASDPREYDNRSNFWLQKMRSNQLSYDNLKLKLQLPGNCSIAAGDVIYVTIPSLEPMNDTTADIVDKLYSGRFIVAHIRHIFNSDRHSMVIEAIKDNFFTSIASLESKNIDDYSQQYQAVSVNTDNDA